MGFLSTVAMNLVLALTTRVPPRWQARPTLINRRGFNSPPSVLPFIVGFGFQSLDAMGRLRVPGSYPFPLFGR